MNKEQIKKKARKLYSKYQSTDPYIICNDFDIIVNKIKMPENLKGHTKEIEKVKFIFINDSLDEHEQKITCIHELAHNMCGHYDNILFLRKYTHNIASKEENEADYFLLNFLLAPYIAFDLYSLTKKQIANMIGVEERLMKLL